MCVEHFVRCPTEIVPHLREIKAFNALKGDLTTESKHQQQHSNFTKPSTASLLSVKFSPSTHATKQSHRGGKPMLRRFRGPTTQ